MIREKKKGYEIGVTGRTVKNLHGLNKDVYFINLQSHLFVSVYGTYHDSSGVRSY